MLYIVEPHSNEALVILQSLASLNVLTLKSLNVDGTLAETDSPTSLTILEQLTAWANEPDLTSIQKTTRTQLIPQLLEYYLNPKNAQ